MSALQDAAQTITTGWAEPSIARTSHSRRSLARQWLSDAPRVEPRLRLSAAREARRTAERDPAGAGRASRCRRPRRSARDVRVRFVHLRLRLHTSLLEERSQDRAELLNGVHRLPHVDHTKALPALPRRVNDQARHRPVARRLEAAFATGKPPHDILVLLPRNTFVNEHDGHGQPPAARGPAGAYDAHGCDRRDRRTRFVAEHQSISARSTPNPRWSPEPRRMCSARFAQCQSWAEPSAARTARLSSPGSARARLTLRDMAQPGGSARWASEVPRAHSAARRRWMAAGGAARQPPAVRASEQAGQGDRGGQARRRGRRRLPGGGRAANPRRNHASPRGLSEGRRTDPGTDRSRNHARRSARRLTTR